MKQLVEDLYPLNRCLLGEGIDNSYLYIDKLIGLDMLEFPSGMKVGTWTIPDEWVVHDAWIKKNDEIFLSYKENPMSLIVGSLPFKGHVDAKELQEHLHYSSEQPSAYPYEYKFYERDWGMTLPMHKVFKREGETLINIFEEADYEVHIDTEYRPGTMKVGVHTIPGKTKREILLFAHLDHPFQANDNLSAVTCLVDIVRHIKPQQFEHTIKIIFCPETIGSIAYAETQDLSNVEFVIALDAIGNVHEGGILLQKSFAESRLNAVAANALRAQGGYRQGAFRSTIGSDEYVFNDPKYGIPGIMLTTHPYPQYHTSFDTPDTIDYTVIERVQKVILKIIEFYEKDFIPERKFTSPLFRSGYGIQSGKSQNLAWDYLVYGMDGRRYLSELCLALGLNFDLTLDQLQRLISEEKVGCAHTSEGKLKKTTGKKSKRVSG